MAVHNPKDAAMEVPHMVGVEIRLIMNTTNCRMGGNFPSHPPEMIYGSCHAGGNGSTSSTSSSRFARKIVADPAATHLSGTAVMLGGCVCERNGCTGARCGPVVEVVRDGTDRARWRMGGWTDSGCTGARCPLPPHLSRNLLLPGERQPNTAGHATYPYLVAHV